MECHPTEEVGSTNPHGAPFRLQNLELLVYSKLMVYIYSGDRCRVTQQRKKERKVKGRRGERMEREGRVGRGEREGRERERQEEERRGGRGKILIPKDASFHYSPQRI